MNRRVKIITFLSFIIFCFTLFGFSQHRGDNLAFQGFGLPDGNGVKALAMGGAYTSISGDINSLLRRSSMRFKMKKKWWVRITGLEPEWERA